jgi:hypothetical protein
LVHDPTDQTQLAAGVLRGEIAGSQADGTQFVTFLLGNEAQAVLARAGFRRIDGGGGSPQGNGVKHLAAPSLAAIGELLRLWQQAG